MNYKIENLLIKQLPPTIYIKNFIDGHSANYEDFLTTFINSSKLITFKGNQKFILRKHEEQNHGETDIFNSYYELDFKILIDTMYMEAKSMLSPSIIEFCPGVIGKGPSRLNGKRKAFDIIKCFRSKTLDDLIKIDKKLIKIPESKTIIQTLKIVSANKNLLLFLPFDYCFDNISTDTETAKFIINCISEDLRCLLEYRNLKIIKDTYISFISKGYFIIAQEKNNTLHFYDMIRTTQSDLYTYLYEVGNSL